MSVNSVWARFTLCVSVGRSRRVNAVIAHKMWNTPCTACSCFTGSVCFPLLLEFFVALFITAGCNTHCCQTENFIVRSRFSIWFILWPRSKSFRFSGEVSLCLLSECNYRNWHSGYYLKLYFMIGSGYQLPCEDCLKWFMRFIVFSLRWQQSIMPCRYVKAWQAKSDNANGDAEDMMVLLKLVRAGCWRRLIVK